MYQACKQWLMHSYLFPLLEKVDVLSYPLSLPGVPNDHVFQGGSNDQRTSGPLTRRLQQNGIRLPTVDHTEGGQANVAKILQLRQRHGSTWVIVNGRRLRKREDLIVGVSDWRWRLQEE